MRVLQLELHSFIRSAPMRKGVRFHSDEGRAKLRKQKGNDLKKAANKGPEGEFQDFLGYISY